MAVHRSWLHVLVLLSFCLFLHARESDSNRQQTFWTSTFHGDAQHVFRSLRQIRFSCAYVVGVNTQILRRALYSSDHSGLQDLTKACNWVKRFLPERRLRLLEAMDDAEAGVPDPCLEEKASSVLAHMVEFPWYAKYNAFGYPWINLLCLALVLIVIILLYERFFLGSTVTNCKNPYDFHLLTATSEGMVAQIKQTCTKTMREHATLQKAIDQRSSEALTEADADDGQADYDYVRFTRRVYRYHVHDGKAIIGVERTGACKDELTVSVKTTERDEASLEKLHDHTPSPSSKIYRGPPMRFHHMKKPDIYFEEFERSITFAKGQRVQTFDVELYPYKHWAASRFFHVDLLSVNSGSERLYPRSEARVCIYDSFSYPRGKRRHFKVHMRRYALAWDFIVECKRIRGPRWWKTYIAVLYPPFHTVVVSSLGQKYMIDWAVDPQPGKWNAHHILILSTVHLFSVMLYRWSQQVASKNRGRTGGIRQIHRIWLLEKLMVMMSMEDLSSPIDACDWFYTAINDVNSITVDVYWQLFVMAENCCAMILSVLLLLYLDLMNAIRDNDASREYSPQHLFPTFMLLLLIPITFLSTNYRKRSEVEHVSIRNHAEADWIEDWNWLSHNCRYGLGLREAACWEKRFRQLSSTFLKPHAASRDWMLDTDAISQWLGHISYLVILIWGAYAVLAHRLGLDTGVNIEVGQYTILLKMFHKFGFYLTKINRSTILILRGSVALTRVERLLNMGMDDVQSDTARAGTANEEYLLLREAHFINESGAFGEMHMKADAEIRIGIGSYIKITGSHQGSLDTALGLLAGTIKPSSGIVYAPGYTTRVMVPPIPTNAGHNITVIQQLQFVGDEMIQEETLQLLANAFGLDPQQKTSSLHPGQLKVISVLQAVLRDPEVLILPNPFALMPAVQRQRIDTMLRVWHSCGGTRGLVCILSDHKDDTHDKRLPRTLVITNEDESLELRASSDVCINLDLLLEDGHYRNGLEAIPKEITKVPSSIQVDVPMSTRSDMATQTVERVYSVNV